MFLGTAICTGELHSFIAFALMSIIYQRKIALEENILREKFGSQFDEYRQSSWALVPYMF